MFAIDVSVQGDWTVVSIFGDLELASAPRLHQRVVGLVSEGHTRLILDLSNVDFVDSVGLGAVVGAVKRTRTVGGDLVVVGAIARVAQVFAVTRLDQIIAMFGDLNSALHSGVDPDSAASGPRGRHGRGWVRRDHAERAFMLRQRLCSS